MSYKCGRQQGSGNVSATPCPLTPTLRLSPVYRGAVARLFWQGPPSAPVYGRLILSSG